jgi:DNA-binding PadR family transcriptional regulator
MRVPRLTHIQFIILTLLQSENASGKQIRDALRRAGIRRSGPGFYQIMARLEDAGWIKGEYQQEIVRSQIIRERVYTLMAPGRNACSDSRDFYVEWIGHLDNGTVPA